MEKGKKKLTITELFAILNLVIVGALFLFGGVRPCNGQTQIPDATNYVVDSANIIDDNVETQLNEKLKAFSKGEIGVLTIKTIQPLTVEQFGIQLADKWKVGKKGLDNGAILIIVSEDRKVRIEVGSGTEALITDAQAGEILDKIIVPELKNGDWNQATVKGVDAIMVRMGGSDPVQAVANTEDGGAGAVVVLIILGVVVVFILVAASPYTPIGGQGTWGVTSLYSPSGGSSFFSSGSSSSSSSGGGFGGFGGGGFGGGGASRGF